MKRGKSLKSIFNGPFASKAPDLYYTHGNNKKINNLHFPELQGEQTFKVCIIVGTLNA